MDRKALDCFISAQNRITEGIVEAVKGTKPGRVRDLVESIVDARTEILDELIAAASNRLRRRRVRFPSRGR